MKKNLQPIQKVQSVSVSLNDLVEFKNEVLMLRNVINAQCGIINAERTHDAKFLFIIGDIQKACAKLDKYFNF